MESSLNGLYKNSCTLLALPSWFSFLESVCFRTDSGGNPQFGSVLCFFLMFQVVPSFVSDRTVAQAWGDQGAQRAAKTEWAERARVWLKRQRVDDGSEVAKPTPKKQRKKSAVWIATVDQILQTCCSVGLDFFRVPKDKWLTSDPYTWPYLGISPDQGPDGVCGGYGMRYGQSQNVEFFYDISHGVWGGQGESMRDVGLESWSHLMVICLNLMHSPWGSEGRYCALMESSKEYLNAVTHRCPLFRTPRLRTPA